MAATRAVDTNVLIYRVSVTPAEAAKRRIAEALLESRDLALSVQALGEFYTRATKRSRSPALTHDLAVQLIDQWRSRYPVQHTDERLMVEALAIRGRYGISYWDSVVVAAAARMGCRELLSEDLGHGQLYAGVRVTNPFRDVA